MKLDWRIVAVGAIAVCLVVGWGLLPSGEPQQQEYDEPVVDSPTTGAVVPGEEEDDIKSGNTFELESNDNIVPRTENRTEPDWVKNATGEIPVDIVDHPEFNQSLHMFEV
jgi:hypothetical protein